MKGLKVILAAVLALVAITAFAADRQDVLIRASKPYDKLVTTIQNLGGKVTYQYKYVDGIAATVPNAAIPTLEKLLGAENIGKDEMMYMPDANSGTASLARFEEAESIAETSEAPADYTVGADISHVSSLWPAGYTGDGIIVAIIDSGYRPMYNHVAPSRVLTGYSLVPGEPNAKDNNNYPHGTQVAGMVAANIAFCFSNTVRFAVAAVAMGAATPGTGTNGCATTAIRVPMVGSAPLATIYPVKVFPYSGAGSPSSRTLAAMEHVLNQRKAYDADHTTGVNIKVLNMSLGGGTSYAGRTLNDRMVEQLLNNDIVTVISAGNEGFSAITGGSPGTSMGALTVGAAQTPPHEWIYRAQFSAPCSTAPQAQVVACAQMWRPDTSIQMSYFSGRGPTHDGRAKPDVTASGSYDFTQGSGTATTVSFVSGTSFSAPETSGIAAVLRQAFPNATGRQIRNAIIMGANPAMIPAAGKYDKGAGYVDASAAYTLLQAGNAPDTLKTDYMYNRNLQANLSQAGLPVYSAYTTKTFTNVLPAQVAEVIYQVPRNAGALYVRYHDILPGAEQNPFFGDDLFLAVQGSMVHTKDRRLPGEYEFINSDTTYSFTRPEEGIWRITTTGDWTNKSPISFSVDVWTTEESSPLFTAKARIAQGQQHVYNLTVPAGVSSLDTTATWLNMNASYPINDIDVILVAPDGTVNYDCGTNKAPEACSIANPLAGQWTLVVDGYSVIPDGTPGGLETYTVRVAADGVVLH
ncbi:MAG TPA: S8 family serine peptidase [Terriglobales bacterium]|nr:S8 family serine peptidase [Terriglobales bacterium]